jgi:hypothetical protein
MSHHKAFSFTLFTEEEVGEDGEEKEEEEKKVYMSDDASTSTSVPTLQDPLDEVSPYCKLHFDLFNVWKQQIY